MMKAGEFKQTHAHLTAPEPEFHIGLHGRVALVIDGTAESAKDQIVICVLASLLDFANVKHGYSFVELRPTTLGEVGRLAKMRPESIGTVLGRLQERHRIYMRQPPRRNYKSRMVIQVGIGPQLTLFAPRLTPEHLFNATSRALLDAARNGVNTEQIRRMIVRAEEHLERFQNQHERERLWAQLQKTKEKYLRR